MVGIGEYIKSLRMAKNYSQRKLGYLANVSNATINRIENNISVPDPETLKKLAGPLGVPYVRLLTIAGYLRENPMPEKTDENAECKDINPELLLKENTEERCEYAAGNSQYCAQCRQNLLHIKDEELKKWVLSPYSADYLIFAKKLSDLSINPDFVLNEFVYKIFKKKR